MMEVEKISSIVTNNYYNDDDDDDDDVALPGFRFHPTDEELVGFYLKRKVENKEISLQLIKQIDIYKYDPWDLPKGSGEKECYFYCRRGRKYKNSLRPNRVTGGSGFWKATGIDRAINNNNGECIGLKKSLVYYKGSAGKGTKTDWQMHEFRLPHHTHQSTKHFHPQQPPAETWTLCRILKRNASYSKPIPDWKQVARKQPVVNVDALSSKLCSNNTIDSSQIYISFSTSPIVEHNSCTNVAENKHQFAGQKSSTGSSSQSTTTAAAAVASSSTGPLDFNEWLEHGNWDELKSIFDPSLDPFL